LTWAGAAFLKESAPAAPFRAVFAHVMFFGREWDALSNGRGGRLGTLGAAPAEAHERFCVWGCDKQNDSADDLAGRIS
jgi:hypothetical protein